MLHDTPGLSCDASRSKCVRRPQHTLDDLPTGKKINFMMTCKLAQMQMTNCIWGYSVNSLHVARFDPVFFYTVKPAAGNLVNGLPFQTRALRGVEMATVERRSEPYDET